MRRNTSFNESKRSDNPSWIAAPLFFMSVATYVRRPRAGPLSLRHIIRAIAPPHAPDRGERMPAHLSLPFTFSSPSPPLSPLPFLLSFLLSPTFLSHLAPHLSFSPPHLFPSFLLLSLTFLPPLTLLPSPCSSNRPTSASASWPVSRWYNTPSTAPPSTQTLDQYGLTPPCCRLNQRKATNSIKKGGVEEDEGDGRRGWAERMGGEDGRRG